jgi:hypothetical protein
LCEHVFVKVAEQEMARSLRRDLGLPVKEIARRVGVSVSSVSLSVRDVSRPSRRRRSTPATRFATLNATAPPTTASGAGPSAPAAQEHGRALARAGDPLHIKGCMLHWAEGSKRRNSVMFTNSDDALIVVFLRFLRRCYGVTDDRMTLSVNCFLGNGLTIDEIQDWWLRRLELPASSLRTPAINRVSAASKRLKGNVLPYGTARLTVHSTFIAQSIYGAIQEYAGIERPEWLDL